MSLKTIARNTAVLALGAGVIGFQQSALPAAVSDLLHQATAPVAVQPSTLPTSGTTTAPTTQPTTQPTTGTGRGTSGSTGNGSSSRTASGTSASSRAQTTGVVLVDVVTQSGEGAGTGMVLTSDGLVLTNYHVVEDSTLVRVTIPDADDAVYTATVVGHDATNDVALLQLEGASGLQTVALDDDGLAVGDAVTAVGNGNGTGVLQTVTGEVLATGQSISVSDESSPTGSEHLSDLIESDVSIVPGYSGGPLFDAEGEVVGINTAGSTSGRVVDAYAIPIGDAMAIVDVIQSGSSSGTVQVGPSAALGISVLPSAQASRGRMAGGTSTAAGVVVAVVTQGSGAEAAGLTAGSTITSVDGRSTGTTAALSAILAEHVPGDVVEVAWTDRTGTQRTAKVTLRQSVVN